MAPPSSRWLGATDRIRQCAYALSNEQRAGEIDADADIDELAAFFTTALIGVAACIRAEAAPERLRAASTVATSILDANHSETRL